MDKVSGLTIGLLAGLMASISTATFMATVVHGRTGGVGDGSSRDAIVLGFVILAPLVGATVGFFVGGRHGR